MKQFLIALCVLSVVSCGNKNKSEKSATEKPVENNIVDQKTTAEKYASYGEKIVADAAISSAEMYERYQNMEIGDTLDVKFSSKVTSVCVKKGCWMTLSLPDGEESRVKFKDYGFFVPKDIENKKVTVEGQAFVTEVSVDDLRHFAEDGGKSEAEIAAITKPQEKLSFVATGVLIEE